MELRETPWCSQSRTTHRDRPAEIRLGPSSLSAKTALDRSHVLSHSRYPVCGPLIRGALCPLIYDLINKRALQDSLVRINAVTDTYPEPVGHCDICRWWQNCDQQRRQDDHLSFV